MYDEINYYSDGDEKGSAGTALFSVFIGFILGALACFLICLCGCRSQKSVTTSVAVDSAAISTTTEIGVVNSEATSLQNLSLHFDSLEMWLTPNIASFLPASSTLGPADGNATANSAVAGPSQLQNVAPFNLADLLFSGGQPIYIKATGATIGSETATNEKNSEIKMVSDSTAGAINKREDSNEEVDRTAVAKPPDTTWVLIAGFAILALLIYFKK